MSPDQKHLVKVSVLGAATFLIFGIMYPLISKHNGWVGFIGSAVYLLPTVIMSNIWTSWNFKNRTSRNLYLAAWIIVSFFSLPWVLIGIWFSQT